MAARASTVATTTGALADGEAGHVRVVVGNATPTGLPVPRLDPAKEARMASLADAEPDETAPLRLQLPVEQAAVLPAAKAEALATVDALTFPSRRPALTVAAEPEEADAPPTPTVAAT